MAVMCSRLIRGCTPHKLDPIGFIPPHRGSVGYDQKSPPGVASARRRLGPMRASVSERAEMEMKTEVDGRRLVGDWATLVVEMVQRAVGKRKYWGMHVQMFIENGITNCRFFTIISVAGSLLGSILCFVEGCFFVLEAFFQYYGTMARRTDEVEVVHLLIEALDLYLVGTALLTFGTGMYMMFLGPSEMKRDKWFTGSSLFGLFHRQWLPSWVEMSSVSEAKSKVGHSVVMILQAGMFEKLKNVPLANASDLACFSGAILFSSACIFILSKLYSHEKYVNNNT